MTFPLQIRQLRRALDLTQAECAAVLGVCPQSICNWEAGRSLPWEKDREGYLASLAHRYTMLVDPLGPPMGSDDTATIKPRQRRRIGDDL